MLLAVTFGSLGGPLTGVLALIDGLVTGAVATPCGPGTIVGVTGALLAAPPVTSGGSFQFKPGVPELTGVPSVLTTLVSGLILGSASTSFLFIPASRIIEFKSSIFMWL
jgi:hypothetical protein